MFHYITINASLIISSMWCFVTSRSMLFSSFIKKTFAFASGLKSVIPYLQKRINTHTHSNPSLSFIFGWSLHRSSLIQTISITNSHTHTWLRVSWRLKLWKIPKSNLSNISTISFNSRCCCVYPFYSSDAGHLQQSLLQQQLCLAPAPRLQRVKTAFSNLKLLPNGAP